MDSSNHISRKEAIKRTGILLGGVVFAPNILGVLNGCKATPGVDWEPVLFSNEQAKLVEALTDIIIPETDTPSASQAGVPAFIESMVNEVYTEDQKNESQKSYPQGKKDEHTPRRSPERSNRLEIGSDLILDFS